MSNDQMNKCVLCLEEHKIMIPFQQPLKECGNLSVAQMLQRVHFLSNSVASKIPRNVCSICVAEVQTCYKFKSKWNLKEKSLMSANDGANCDPPEDPLMIPVAKIKKEED